jgi:hypothetical protein
MSSDRERVSTDPAQQYRSVVFQQGRVTLASDANEAQDIGHEALRAAAADIVGPDGTPDNGYAISWPGESGFSDFRIGRGTMYLGGERVELAGDITYFGQRETEWLDLPNQQQGADHDLAWLLVREQELGGVEVPNLLEVALGGPDTAARTRLVQRVMRQAVPGPDCQSAWISLLDDLREHGYGFDPGRMRLAPFARLQVGFAGAAPEPDPCQPAPQGGYLKADNQCVRVMVTDWNPDTRTARIVWAFDNASHLVRAVLQNDMQTLKLAAPPVDAFHWPRAGQAVEVLQSAVRLADGSTMAQNHGQVGTLAADYNADQRTVQLTTALGDPFVPGADDPPLFLRLWEQALEARPGEAVTLGDTGLQVTLTTDVISAIAPGLFWVFAVRPSTPQEVYPHRYLAAPQPPDGPRLWACPLGVLHLTQAEQITVTDCRVHFDNLVELSKRKSSSCCEFTVGKGGAFPDLAAAFTAILQNELPVVSLCLLPEPPVHKLDQAISLRLPQMRLEIRGSAPFTVLEVTGGGFDVAGIQAFVLHKLDVRLLDERSQFMVRACEALEICHTHIGCAGSRPPVPILDSGGNRSVRIEDSTLDAGYAVFAGFVDAVGAASPLTAPLLAVELLQAPQGIVNALIPLAQLSVEQRAVALERTKRTAAQFDLAPYKKPMQEWFRAMGRIGADGTSLNDVVGALVKVLQQILEVRLTLPASGVVLDHLGDHWLESSVFRCPLSFTGAPARRLGTRDIIQRSVELELTVAPNGHVIHLKNCRFDLLTYGDALLDFLFQEHAAANTLFGPTSLVVEGCLFELSPCFFIGNEVFLTNNHFTYPRDFAAGVLSNRFLPVANTAMEGPILFRAGNDVEPFRPINVAGLMRVP